MYMYVSLPILKGAKLQADAGCCSKAYGQRESFRYHTVKASEDLMVCFMHMLLTSQGKSIVHPYIRVYCSEYSAYFGFVCSYYNNSNEFVSMETIKIIFL